MIKVVDIVYHCHSVFSTPQQVLAKHQPVLGFTAYINGRLNYEVIRHLNYEGKEIINGIPYAFFKRSNAAWQIPFRTHRYIKSLQPDIVLVHGFIFPLQVIALKLLLGKKTAIILQHHAEYPANSVRKIFQTIADRCVATYMFTAADIARPWLDQKIIRDKNKIAALPGASVFIEKKNKIIRKQKLHFNGNRNFLWVGRLNENKDPITILKAFEQYASANPAIKLFMIYQTEELLAAVKEMINNSIYLSDHVQLVGKISPEEMPDWYNAADFFISGSHAEAAGYALLEAMCVGCIPIVTEIPSYQKIINNGEAGLLFTPGNAQQLAATLKSLDDIDIDKLSASVENYFHQHLSHQTVADGIVDLCTKLNAVQR